MSVQIVRNVNISGCGMGMMPMGGMMPIGGCCPGMGMSVFCRPYPMVGGAMLAGACIGAALATPGVIDAIGSVVKPVVNFAGQALQWGYNNVVLPVWNNVIKPAWNFAYNNILKPVGNFLWNDVLKPLGNGLKWIWDHTLGWVLKKIDGSGSSKAAEETAEAATEAES